MFHLGLTMIQNFGENVDDLFSSASEVHMVKLRMWFIFSHGFTYSLIKHTGRGGVRGHAEIKVGPI